MFIKIGTRYINLDQVTDVLINKYTYEISKISMSNGDCISIDQVDGAALGKYLDDISMDIRKPMMEQE